MFTESQLLALAVAPKITSFLSIIGSSVILSKVLRSPLRRSRSHHRLLAGMSVYDLFASFSQFFSTWASPVGTAKFAVGNITTCTVQGFFLNFNLSVALYNTALSVYYLLIVRFNFDSKKMNKIELVMHLLPLIHALCGVILVFDKALNNAGQVCWVSSVPKLCEGDSCLRGKRAGIYTWIMVVELLMCITVATISTLLLYWTVYQQHQSMEKRQSMLNPTEKKKRKKKLHDVTVQTTLYLGAFYLTWMFSVANRVYSIVHKRLLFGLLLFGGTVHPLQGFLNMFVYMRKELFVTNTNTERTSRQNSVFESIFKKQNNRQKSNVSNVSETNLSSKPPSYSDELKV